jgi:hypothetical protein
MFAGSFFGLYECASSEQKDGGGLRRDRPIFSPKKTAPTLPPSLFQKRGKFPKGLLRFAEMLCSIFLSIKFFSPKQASPASPPLCVVYGVQRKEPDDTDGKMVIFKPHINLRRNPALSGEIHA